MHNPFSKVNYWEAKCLYPIGKSRKEECGREDRIFKLGLLNKKKPFFPLEPPVKRRLIWVSGFLKKGFSM